MLLELDNNNFFAENKEKGAVKKVPQQGSQCLKALATKN